MLDDYARYQVFSEASRVVGPYLYRHSVSVLNTTTRELFSGTLVSIPPRLFIATASHVLSNCATEELMILSRELKTSNETGLRVLRAVRQRIDHPDVGFLEVPCDDGVNYTRQVPCSLEKIDGTGGSHEARAVTLIGNPSDRAQAKVAPGRLDIASRVCSLATCPIPRSDWPEVPAGYPPADSDIDVFLDFPREGGVRADDGTPITLGSPMGMSGGGLWSHGLETGELWSPQSAILFAIQGSWNETERYVRATKAIHWLRLVWTEYYDLREQLVVHAPMLASAQKAP